MSQARANSDALDRLLTVVGEVLGAEVRDASVSFLGLGGDSLAGIIVTEMLREAGIGLNVENLLSARPLCEVASLAEGAG